MTNDFAHHLPLNQLRDGQRIDLVADEAERRDIAERLGLKSLERLEAHATLDRDGDSIRVRGRLRARLTQDCVVTGDAIETHADEPFDIRFIPEPEAGGGEEGLELGQEECDTVFHDGAAIDLGSAIGDSLALGLDPYPRSAGAEAALREAGVLSEGEAGPFAALARLKGTDTSRD